MRLNPPKPPKAPSESDHPPDSIPAFGARGFLPEGFHTAAWAEVAARFGQTEHRRKLLDGLQQACLLLHRAGVEGGPVPEREFHNSEVESQRL